MAALPQSPADAAKIVIQVGSSKAEEDKKYSNKFPRNWKAMSLRE
jgi:hypothetical protein